jgi:hypothetical protein
VRQPTRKTRGSRRLTIRYVVSRSRWYTSCRTGAFDLAGVSRYQPNDLKRACVDLRGRRKEKPRRSGAYGANQHSLARSSFYAVTPKNSVKKGLELWIITGKL